VPTISEIVRPQDSTRHTIRMLEKRLTP